MKNYKIILCTFLLLPLMVLSQEKKKDSIVDKPSRPAFESATLIDNATDVLFNKNTLEVMMQHRFGEINGGTNDLAGFWGASNIRIALSYALHDRLTVGFGTTKEGRLQDFNWKVGLLRQTRSDKTPLNISYYGNFTIDARPGNRFYTKQDRYSYFHQIIFSRRFSPNVSFQIAPSISHYNTVESFMENDRFAIAFGGRAKISPQTSILLDYSQPITQFKNVTEADGSITNYNHPGISLGVEFGTSNHAFQLFITNFRGIVPQQNYMKTTNDFFNGDFLIGFNITRNYNF
ncbi:DUF5777 family beta-barrel protein [Seonamhaeicola aphaedonensis]|uniref:DUF5777 domain-containing protein n=1 Tax=Seonamhaeicola aphaedonensis TaxID=1461338 RepID=A0A3D9H5L1_9FLAO|nr:DUF5777 family beta-barrel protein [Seonamhaeicola aphaedonensis]RED44722.1 hypothetical protein DFQ02_11025 [Seonamhaeicola aphaedonensis]